MAQEKKYAWVNALSATANGTLTAKDKISLETYVQMTYFDRIIYRANLRFMKMSDGQYELERVREAENKRSQSGLELCVIDHYNGTRRSVKSLSGGESFMASLSLALGLSDEVQESAGGIQDLARSILKKHFHWHTRRWSELPKDISWSVSYRMCRN